jgi:hypothetical protein
MVRYDGLVTGCCNESVIMNFGPARLRRRISSRQEMDDAVHAFHADPLLRAIGGVGLGALTAHPRFADLAETRFTSICHLCWQMLDRMPEDGTSDRLIESISLLETSV